MKRILVTGGNGFLGQHLCKRLIKDGNEVVVLDRSQPRGIHLIRYDIINPLPDFEVDEIYNLAGTPSPAKYLKNPIHTAQTNTIGMINVLELARKCKAKVFQASTGEVYEDSDITGPRACYRQGKRMAETLCCDYARNYGVDVRIARMFNFYGPGMALDDGKVIPVFIQKALKNEDIYLFGDQVRSFCYVMDVVEAMILLMTCSNHVPIVNVSGESYFRILDLAKMIVKEVKSKSEIIQSEGLKDDSKQLVPKDLSAQDLLGWQPKVAFTEGLKKTIKYFRGRDYVE